MKKLSIFILLLLPCAVIAQPAGYYLPASGLNGQPLRIALMNIIRTHTALSYTPGLWNAYYTTDVKPDGKLWDIYSDKPGGTPAYEFTLGTNQCSGSSPSAEDGCYNREHTWPQSLFGSAAPMQTDLFIVYPTDYYVNSHRGNYPYGKVGTATMTFTNGGKIGNNVYAGAPTGDCFEPIDSFKGDVARNYFYVATCYRNDSAAFTNWEMANGVNFTAWSTAMLLEWHHNDPVSKKETDRNNAVYALQGNRNPFIDHPEYADCIWGTGDCSSNSSVSLMNSMQSSITVYPNPASNEVNIRWNNGAYNTTGTLKVYNMTGQQVYAAETESNSSALQLSVNGWPAGVYSIQLTTSGSRVIQQLVIQ